jgi:hypothetical protein
MPSPQEHTFTFVAVALRRLLAPVQAMQTDGGERFYVGFPQPSRETEREN